MMRVIDAHTGLEVKVGDRIPLPDPRVFSTPESSKARLARGLSDYYYEVVAIRPGIFSATMDAWFVEGGHRRFVSRAPLQVRWTHPGYPWQHVAFVPT
jgi:hypothetical protein